MTKNCSDHWAHSGRIVFPKFWSFGQARGKNLARFWYLENRDPHGDPPRAGARHGLSGPAGFSLGTASPQAPLHHLRSISGRWSRSARSWRTPPPLTPPKTMLFGFSSSIAETFPETPPRLPLPIHSAVATKPELRESERFGGVVKII